MVRWKVFPTNELPPLHDPFNNFNLAYDATQKSNVLNKYFCSITKLNDDDAVLPDFQLVSCESEYKLNCKLESNVLVVNNSQKWRSARTM
jgi:hypothetical protein